MCCGDNVTAHAHVVWGLIALMTLQLLHLCVVRRSAAITMHTEKQWGEVAWWELQPLYCRDSVTAHAEIRLGLVASMAVRPLQLCVVRCSAAITFF
eukprot:gene11037-biopygen7777